MKQLNLARCILETMPPVDNELQSEIKDYLERNIELVDNMIYDSSRFKSDACIINALVSKLRADVCFQIYNENL